MKVITLVALLLGGCATTHPHPEYLEFAHYPYKALWCPNNTPDSCLMGGHFLKLERCLEWTGKIQPEDVSSGYWCCSWLSDGAGNPDDSGKPIFVRVRR